jgi:Tol biopolymer transport system component
VQLRSELVRYDAPSKQFVPVLGGLDAIYADYSRDGKWIAFGTVTNSMLWRVRVDGSERLQLTYPPMRTTLPRWSPDGSRIAYLGLEPGNAWKIFLISAQGGSPEELLPENRTEVDANWTPDGTHIIFGRGVTTPKELEIEMVDLKTRQLSTIPGSHGLFSPRLSPDGHYLAAISYGSKKLMLYDMRTEKWSEWVDEPNNVDFPTWSSDSQSMIYNNVAAENPKCLRIKLGEHTPQVMFSLNGLSRYYDMWGSWSGLAPDDSRLFIRDNSAQEIYALDVDLP